MRRTRHDTGMLRRAGLLCLLAVATAFPAARAQDISEYRIATDKDIFLRETASGLAATPTGILPILDCSVEYIRRYEGRDITYRRGPIPLRQTTADQSLPENPEAAEPSSDGGASQRYFTGGMLLDLPRAGETVNYLSSSDESKRYLIRVSIIPLGYRNSALEARILLERAVVDVDGHALRPRQSEVFSRTVTLHGNDPLNFALPTWEPLRDATPDVIPSSLEEAMLITLETPRNSGFSRNLPEPFSGSTRLTYALNTGCTVTVTIRTQGSNRVIDQGRREAGVYQVLWEPGSLPDGKYLATMEAKDSAGAVMHSAAIEMTKDRNAASYTAPRLALAAPDDVSRFTASTESGFAYQFPIDQKKSLRNMFTHVAVRIGYRVSRRLEIGIVGGQDSFHEYPGPLVDIDRITDYGGVVPYTTGYVGAYTRVLMGSGDVQPVAQFAVAYSNVSTITEIGFGARMTLFRRVQLFVIPSAVSHLKSTVSTKIGIHYGIGVAF
ncbi:MAG: hypothetical protein IPP94_02275 [Ignavibacteria bacterium]|nr:hypothetical protein [Ignavibacteria bacterium]